MIISAIFAFVSVALAAPAALLEERQSFDINPSVNELTGNGAKCKANTLIYARGATELGNLVRLILLPIYLNVL
jgi:hypothetical protein